MTDSRRISKIRNKKKRELEVILTAAAASLMFSFSFALLLAVLLGTDIHNWFHTAAVCVYFIITGILWIFLVVINSPRH